MHQTSSRCGKAVIVAAALTACLGKACTAAQVREFDAWIMEVRTSERCFTVRHNATQYTVTLKTDKSTNWQRIRQAPFEAFPTGKRMRFWGAITADGSAITIQGIRLGSGDEHLPPAITPAQNYIGGRLLRENGRVLIEAGPRRVSATVDPHNFAGFFEEEGDAGDLAPGRQAHVRYVEEPGGGRALAVVVTKTLPQTCRPPSPASGVTPEQVRQTFADIARIHERIAPQLARLMPVTMSITPELASVGEEVVLKMEVLATEQPSATAVLHPDFLVRGIDQGQVLELPWKAAGQRCGLNIYRAERSLPAKSPGSYFVTWSCPSGEIRQYSRYFAVIDDSYAVCSFLSTSHRGARPAADFYRLHIPYEEWIGSPLVVNEVLNGDPRTWASWSQEARQFGTKVNPHLFGPYWVRGTPSDPQANLQAESPETQRAILAGYRDLMLWLGYGPTEIVSAYTMNNSFCQAARQIGYRTISSLCPGQNFMDGPMRINHFGMPERPYFLSDEDFRKPGPGGPSSLVGISQCQRNTFLNREFNCTYCLEPAWNEYYNEGGGRSVVDDIWMSRMYDFFQAMLENRLSQKSPYFFSVGLEFNGMAPGIAEGNRLLLEYAVKKARSMPLVFATGPAVSEYYRRRFARTPESTCYQQDYFGGLTKLDKFPGYPDTMEIEGPDFQSLLRSPQLLPTYHYDYSKEWNYPAWGNDQLPRNQWGYLYPGQHDPFQVVPKILDTRGFDATRSDAGSDRQWTITLTVRATMSQKNLVLGLWDIPCQWRSGDGWWSVAGTRARFVPVRAPLTGNLNGLLVADVATGENKFTVTIQTPAAKLVRSTVKIGNWIEGRVFHRDGQTMAYLWPTRPWNAMFIVNLPRGRSATVMIAPAGEGKPLKPGPNRLEIPAGRWIRLIGLSADEISLAQEI